MRAPLTDYRVSVLWKADVYQDAAERRELGKDTLSIEDVASIFNDHLEQRGKVLRVDLERLEDLEHLRALGALYPEPIPLSTGSSIYDKFARATRLPASHVIDDYPSPWPIEGSHL